jgi:hypothetical protein
MLRQFIVGIAISPVNLSLHALGTIMLDRIVQRYWREVRRASHGRVLLAFDLRGHWVAHFTEVLVWASFYALLGVSLPGTDAVYFALSQYTTLGHSEAIPLHEWALLGPITAANGLLLFGWPTAVIVEVVRTTIPGLRA